MFLAKGAVLFFVLCMSAPHARAQNQTPANVGPVVGAWTDPDTSLTWTKQENGSDVNWYQANAYCSNLRQGGYSDWRLPTIDELQAIYDPSVDIPGQDSDGEAVTWHVKGNVKLLNGAEWSSTQFTDGAAWFFYFGNRTRRHYNPLDSHIERALCVRR
jgi:hypothetical protein